MPLGAYRINSLAKFTVTAQAEVIRAKKGVTAVGNAQIDTAQSKFSGSSALFDGTGDYLTISSNSDFGFGTGDFTIELWLRLNNTSGTKTLFDCRTSLGTDVAPTVYVASGGQVRYYTAGADRITGSTLSINTWYHIALSKSGSNTKLFVDGTQVGSTYTDNNNYGTTNPLKIGTRWDGSTNYHNGHIDELRISNTAHYTANFTAPTAPFDNDANTVLLLHMDGTDATTYFEDDNGVRTPVSITAFGNAQIDTADSKFGGSSALFDGTGDYLRAGTTGFLYSAGSDVTMECWFKLNSSASGEFNGIMSMGSVRGSSSNEWNIFVMINSSTGFNRRLQMGHNYSILVGSTTNLSLNTWYHVAATRSGTTFTLWLDGVSQGTNTSTRTLGQNTGMKIAALADGTLPTYCWIDEVRVSNIARYTTGFTPSTTPFVNDSNTQLLLHMDGTDATTVFRDDNGVRSQASVIALGTAQIATAQSQFGNASAYFNGSNSGLKITPSQTFDLSGDFTVEMFTRGGPSPDPRGKLIDGRHVGLALADTFFLDYSGTKIRAYVDNADRTSTNSFSNTTWVHIALQRTGTLWELWLNGTRYMAYTSASVKNTSFPAENDFYLGISDSNTDDFLGYIDEVRISKTARYTSGSSITVPTAAFVNDSDTLLLLHMDGTNSSTVFYDDNGVTPDWEY